MIEGEITQHIFKGERKAREKEKKWVVSKHFYSKVGTVLTQSS